MDSLIDILSAAYVSFAVAFITGLYISWLAFGKYRGSKRSRVLRFIPFIVTVCNALIIWARVIGNVQDFLSFLDTPREVIVVVGSLALILCSIVCTIYFRPARMTVIAGVALGFIAAVLFAEGVFAAQEYMNHRLGR